MYSFHCPVLLINDLDIAKLVLIKDFDCFQSRGIYAGEVGDKLAANLFNISEPRWKSLRPKMTPTFTIGKLKAMYPIIEAIANKALNYVSTLHSSGQVINFSDFYAKYAMEIIGNIGFGVVCDGLNDASSTFHKQGQEYFDQKSTYWTTIRAFAFFAPNVFDYLRVRRISSTLDDFFYNIVNTTVEHKNKNSYRSDDFMQTLIELKNGQVVDEKGKKESNQDHLKDFPFSMDDVAAHALLYMIAGYETSSATGQFAAYQLAQNLHIQARAREEIRRVLEKYGGQCTFEAQNEMVYLNMILDETMRIHPSMRALFRRCNQTYSVADTDLVIEAVTLVFVPVHGIHMDPDIFSEPDKFDPERFSPENKAKLHPCHWMPFGEGPRKCLGIKQGYIQSKIAPIKVLQRYELHLDKRTSVPMRVKPSSLVNAADGDIWIHFKKIDDVEDLN